MKAILPGVYFIDRSVKLACFLHELIMFYIYTVLGRLQQPFSSTEADCEYEFSLHTVYPLNII